MTKNLPSFENVVQQIDRMGLDEQLELIAYIAAKIQQHKSTSNKKPSLKSIIGTGKGSFTTPEEADNFISQERDNNAPVSSAYQNAIQNSQVLEVVPINRTILIESARLRSTTNLRLPDAIHVATAILSGCETFLTNDKRLEALSGIDVVVLSSLLSA